MSKTTEQEMRAATVETPTDLDALTQYVSALVEREHNYGTCVYAMSMAAQAAFKFVASNLGVSGFQASCAELDFLRRSRGMKCGFAIINYENLLYPQCLTLEYFPTPEKLIDDNCEVLGREAQKRLAESPYAHPAVLAHWRRIIADMETKERKDT